MTTSTDAEPAGHEATVAANVRRLREAAGISQVELAVRIAKSGYDFSEMAVCNIENGKRRIRVDDLFPLGGALDVNPLSLLRPGAGRSQLYEITFEGGVTEQVRADDYDLGDEWISFHLQGQLAYRAAVARVFGLRLKPDGGGS